MNHYCAWLDDESEPCGEPAEPWRNLALCPEHTQAMRERMQSPLRSLARASARYHELSDYPGSCYFALLPDGSVKIGFSHTRKLVEHRMKALTRQYEAPVVLLRVIPGGFVAEAAMHERFAHLRLPGTGERFARRGELLEYLAVAEAA